MPITITHELLATNPTLVQKGDATKEYEILDKYSLNGRISYQVARIIVYSDGSKPRVRAGDYSMTQIRQEFNIKPS